MTSKTKERVKKAYEEAGIPMPEKLVKKSKQEKRSDFIKRKLTETFSTDAGIVALAYIYSLAGGRLSDAVPKNKYGAIDKDGTMYNAARRSLYLELTNALPRDVLKQAEFYQLQPEEIEND